MDLTYGGKEKITFLARQLALRLAQFFPQLGSLRAKRLGLRGFLYMKIAFILVETVMMPILMMFRYTQGKTGSSGVRRMSQISVC